MSRPLTAGAALEVAQLDAPRSELPHLTSASEPQLLPPPRMPLDGLAFNTLCQSARTSYTRVEQPADDGVEAVPEEPDALGDGPMEPAEQQPPPYPQVALTFLLITGRRRTMIFEPETTVGRVKELVWNAWPNDWQDERPPAPSYLRILYLGKILQDDDTLSQLNFPACPPSAPTPPASPLPPLNPGLPTPTPTHGAAPGLPQATIVHLSVRAAPPSGAEDAPAKKRRRRGEAPIEEGEGGAGCCACVVC